MNGLPYYKAYPRDFLDGTVGMTLEAKGAYRIVLDLIYLQGGNLPDDARYIAGHLGCSVKKWNAIRDALISAGKLAAADGYLRNYRADKELEILGKFQDKQRENRSRPNKNKDIQSPRSHHTDTDTDTDRDTNVSLSKRAKPERFQEFWDTYPHRGGAKKNRTKCAEKYARHVAAGVPEQDIIAGAVRYAADRQVVQGYAKNPETWLNNRGWEDDIEPASGPRRAEPGRSDGYSALVQGFAAFANRDDDASRRGFGADIGDADSGDEEMDFGSGGYASQPILRLVGSV